MKRHALRYCWVLLLAAVGSPASLADSGVIAPECSPAGFALSIEKNDPESAIVVRVSVKRVAVSLITVGGQPFTVVEIEDAGATFRPGEPQLPVISRPFQISNTRDVLVEVRELRSHTVILEAPVLPSQECDPEDVASVASYDRAVYASKVALPAERLWTGRPEILRDLRVLQVSFCPVRYSPALRRLEIVDEAEIHIRAGRPSGENILAGLQPPIGPTWGGVYRAAVANYNPAREDRAVRERYLVILPDAAVEAVSDWVAWKETEGFVVNLVRTSETGVDAAAIRQRILEFYGGFERPTYVLLAGDETLIPTVTSYDGTDYGTPHHGDYVDDSFYALLDGTDYLPDVLLARLPAASPAEIETMLARALFWETTPNITDDYYPMAAMTASATYPSYETVKLQTAERLRTVHHFTTVFEEYGWDPATLYRLIGDLNQGISILNYLGESWQHGWNPQQMYSFSEQDVDNLANTNRPLVVTSISSGVGKFTEGPSFGESWLRVGSTAEVRGAVAFLGATWFLHTTFGNWLDRGLYRALAYEDASVVAAAYLAGKLHMRANFPEPELDPVSEVSFRCSLQLGTPDTRFRTILPDPPLVALGYPGNSMVRLLVARSAENWPAVGARVVLDPHGADPDYLTLGDGGEAEIDLPPEWTSLPLLISGYNMKPTEIEIPLAGGTGLVIITEVKPNVPTSAEDGDTVELFNFDDATVDLKGMIVSDLDMVDTAITTQSAPLAPGQFAVVHFVGPRGEESIATRPYGLEIFSRAYPDMSSEEDQCVLRDATGQVIDGLGWHNGSGVASLNEASDMSRLTGAETPFTMGIHAWWGAPNWLHEDTYEQYTVDWSAYAGTELPEGSIQRVVYPRWDGPPDEPSHFEVRAALTWGSHSSPPVTPTPTVVPTPRPLGVYIEMPATAHPGEPFHVTGYLDNPGSALAAVPVFFVLDVYGEFWFWDSWIHFVPPDGEIDFQQLDVPPGSLEVSVIPAFDWPDTGTETVTGLRFWGAMLNETMDGLLGEAAMVEWGYGP